MTVNWTKVEGATHYQIYYETKGKAAKSIVLDAKNSNKTIRIK